MVRLQGCDPVITNNVPVIGGSLGLERHTHREDKKRHREEMTLCNAKYRYRIDPSLMAHRRSHLALRLIVSEFGHSGCQRPLECRTFSIMGSCFTCCMHLTFIDVNHIRLASLSSHNSEVVYRYVFWSFFFFSICILLVSK